MGDPQRTDEETPSPSGSVIYSSDQHPEKAARNNWELQPRFPWAKRCQETNERSQYQQSDKAAWLSWSVNGSRLQAYHEYYFA